ncbi:MAG: hypothetical protein N3F63_03170 [Thermoplasmata archaeon]|nr:hypothetical protein [Thermoplasmata archaeon]
MTSPISEKVYNIMGREMGHIGRFIVQKQCKDLGINPEDIKTEDLPKIAKALGDVMKTFGGEDKGKAIEAEIRRLAQSH